MNSVHHEALRPTPYIDADAPDVRAFVERHAGTGTAREKAVRLYYAVRDAIRYDMTTFGLDPAQFRASNVLNMSSAFCVPKAIALAATARAAGIPACLGFADVRNHLTSPRFAALMDDDLFRWHAYTSLWLDGRWVKATPAFDIALCEKHGVKPLEFDGGEDSISCLRPAGPKAYGIYKVYWRVRRFSLRCVQRRNAPRLSAGAGGVRRRAASSRCRIGGVTGEPVISASKLRVRPSGPRRAATWRVRGVAACRSRCAEDARKRRTRHSAAACNRRGARGRKR
jgi:Transglutaminase-like superfamily